MPVFNNALAGAAGSGGAAGYKIERSLRFNDDDNAHLSKSFGTSGNRKKWTYSTWVKRSKLGAEQMFGIERQNINGSGYEYMRFDSNDRIDLYLTHNGSNWSGKLQTEARFRDVSAWMHVVLVCDIENSTQGDRIRLYVNGVRVTTFSSSSYPATTEQTSINHTGNHHIGKITSNSQKYDGYLAETHFLDGIAVSDPDGVFGEFDADTGVWNPIEYTGTHGTNGFHLDFSDNSSNAALGFDANVSGTRYSAYVTGFGSPGPANMFDGDATTSYAVSASNTRMTFTPPTAIPYLDASGGVEVKFMASASGQQDRVRINGGSWVAQPAGGGWHKVSTGDGSITSMDFEDEGTSEAVVHAIRVNGTILTNPAGANDWTVNNLTAKGGVTITSAKIYSSYNGATVSANYSVQWSDDNSNWTTAFSGVMSNNGQCGIQTGTNPGNGSYGAHKYWKLLIGSVVASHWPRSSRILLSDGANDYAVRTFTSDNCSDSGGIPQNGDSYTYTSSLGPADLDSLIDSPTNYESSSGNNGGNYCTMSPIDHHGCTFSNGNLNITAGSSKCGRGTFWANSGKWYFEFDITTYGNPYVGIASRGTLQHYVSANSIAINNGGNIYVSTNGSQTYPGKSRRLNAIGSYMCAFDLDNGKIWWGKDGIWYEQSSGANNSIALSTVEAGNGATEFSSHPSFGDYWTVQFGTSTSTSAYSLNAGQRPFIYPNSIPSGFKSLCTQNLDDPLIANGSDYFQAKTYSGSNSSQSITTNFSPDLTWIKNRSDGAADHILGNSLVPGAHLYSNGTWTEGSGRITSLNSNGFTVGTHDTVNQSGDEYISWNWNGGDLATNSAYNQSEEWSSKLSTYLNSFGSEPVINLFDGDTSTSFYSSSTSGSGIKFVPTTAITGSIELYLRNGDTSNSTFSYSLDNGSTFTNLTTTGGNGSYVSIGNQTISNTNGIIVRHVTTAGTNQVNWRAIKVDNKVLVDPGVISIGSLNSTVYNTSSNWSVAGSNMQNNWSASFDGDTDPHFALPNTGYSASMTFPSAISYQTLELVVCRDIYAPDLLMNGNALNVPKTDTNTTGGRYKIERYYFTNGTLTSIGHETRNTAGRGGSGFWQIIVDGKILVDTNQASNVTNVPSITTKCTSNPDAGFAISTYKGNSTDGATIATNLGNTPEMVIVKARDKSDDWRVYHVGAGNPYYLRLQLTNNKTGTNNWREMSLNYFALDADSAVNSSSYNYVAYSFSSVPGYSAIGSYEANSNSDGPLVVTGFRPAFVMVKNIDDTQHSSAYNWTIVDTSRYPNNENSDLNALYANSTANEDTYTYGGASTGLNIDILSNGFKLRSASAEINHGNTYIYYAVAENPFKIARAR